MKLYYETEIEGIDEMCTCVCPCEKVERERLDAYRTACNKWVICKDYSSHRKDDRKVLCSYGNLRMLYSCALHDDVLIFKTHKEGWEYLQNMDAKSINAKDPDNEDGISYWDVIPLYDYQPTMVGSANCQECKYCYGRSKEYCDFVMIGANGRFIPGKEQYVKCPAMFRNPDFSWKIRLRRKLYHFGLKMDKLFKRK